MKILLESIVKSLVDNKDDIKVVEINLKDSILYQLHVSDDDLGKLIGKKGKTILAIRTIISAASLKAGIARSVIEIIED